MLGGRGLVVVVVLAASAAESLMMITTTTTTTTRPAAASSSNKKCCSSSSSIRGRQAWSALASSSSSSSSSEDDGMEDSEETSALYASLRSRQRQVDMEGASLTVRWRKGRCASRVVAALGDDWCRRCAMDYPLCAFGTASGAVHVVDASKPVGSLIVGGESVHPRSTEFDTSQLDGSYDGGGVTAIGIKGTTVATGGRDGELKLWRVSEGTSLSHEATLKCEGVVSGVKISPDEEFAVASCLDGSVARFNFEAGEWRETWKVALDSEALCVALSRDSSTVACGLANGSVKTLDASSGSEKETWAAFDKEGARSVSFDDEDDWMYAGCMDGTVKRVKRDDSSLKEEKLLPSHQAPVVSISRRKGILATAGQDSTIRIWDLGPRSDKQPPRCLFAFNGYKVWIGSVDCDQRRLISDGSDNTIIMHDFGDDSS